MEKRIDKLRLLDMIAIRAATAKRNNEADPLGCRRVTAAVKWAKRGGATMGEIRAVIRAVPQLTELFISARQCCRPRSRNNFLKG